MKKYRVEPGETVKLRDLDPSDNGKMTGDVGKAKAELDTAKLCAKLERLQELLYATGTHALLVVLQAMDAGGKDGTVKHVMEGLNPAGVRVVSFKAPTPEELGHDFLWRVHAQVPRKGMIGIFNRSHYEDVLITRVHGLVSDKAAEKRFRNINDFERLLTESGTVIQKFFLHISKDEQRQRMEDRLSDPEKHWKFNPGDLGERDRWDDYMEAYEEAISATSTKHAPWHVVPSNQKWYRNYVVASCLVDALERLDLQFPPLPDNLKPSDIRIP
ncbi:MAG TPA: polyphosphate kinase 2 family protein [Deinococcales bacterium]|nr:polyphosphate kinase 2 family protein [Deinococcales bacterium]